MLAAMSRAGSRRARSYADVATCRATKYVIAEAPTTRNSSEGIRNSRSRRRMLPRRPGGSAITGFPQIAETADRADTHTRCLDLRAQTRYVDFDGVGTKLSVVIGELLRDLLLAQHASGPGHEQLEKRPFPRREIDRGSPATHALGFDVDRELPH